MSATCSDATKSVIGNYEGDSPSQHPEKVARPENFLYQAAIVIAILLFLVSF
jgi:hypothetical protein